MLLREGTAIETREGPFGSLSDVIVDPTSSKVTDLIVNPDGELFQTRVVPVWLTNEVPGGVRVELDLRHTLQLQRSLPGDYVEIVPTEMESEHDLHFHTVLQGPFIDDPNFRSDNSLDERRVPIDEFELRCGSDVISTNDRDLGDVVGFLTADELVHAMVVRSGLVGFTNDVVVPLSAIAEVIADMIVLDIDRHEFRALELTSLFATGLSFDGVANAARNVAAQGWYRIRDRAIKSLAS